MKLKKRRLMIWICFAVLIPVVLLLLVSVLFYIPAVQNFSVRKISAIAFESLGVEIGFERLRLKFPLDFSAFGVYALNDGKDTLATIEKVTLNIEPKHLINGCISIKQAAIETLKLNTGNFIDGVEILGKVGSLSLRADSINLKEETSLLNKLSISGADVFLAICDTTKDTTSKDFKWKINFEDVQLTNVLFSLGMPCDSVFADVDIRDAALKNGWVDLLREYYGVKKFNLDAHALFYGTDKNKATSGLDVSHLKFSDVHIVSDSVYYAGGTNFSAIIKECYLSERCGLEVQSLSGTVHSDSSNIVLKDFFTQTSNSTLALAVDAPWTAIDKSNPQGKMSLNFKSSIGKKDIANILGDTVDFYRNFPDTTFLVRAVADGNLKNINLRLLGANLGGAFEMKASGTMHDIVEERKRSGNFDMDVKSGNLAFAKNLLPNSLKRRIQIPDSMQLVGKLVMNKGNYSTDFAFSESDGKVKLSGNYNIFSKNYVLDLDIDSLEPVHFLPDDSIMLLSAFVRAKGKGTDIFKAATNAEIEGEITDIKYGNFSVSDIALKGTYEQNHLLANLGSNYPLIVGNVSIEGDITKEKIKTKLTANVDSMDLQGLHIAKKQLGTSFRILAEAESDLKKNNTLDFTLDNWNLMFENQTVQPKNLIFNFRSNADTTQASFHAGDLHMILTGDAELRILIDKMSRLSDSVKHNFNRDSLINLYALREYFPNFCLKIKAEQDNPLYNILQFNKIFFEKLFLDIDMSPEKGITADGFVYSLVRDTFKIDTVNIGIYQDSVGLQYAVDVVKKRFRRQEAFTASANGYLGRNGGDIFLSYKNNNGEDGILLGANIKKSNGEYDFNLYPENPVIMFLPFTLSENNYFRFKSKKEMSADLRLKGVENASIWLHSDDAENGMNEMMLEASHIDLSKVSEGFSELPSLSGILDVALRYIPEEKTFAVVADASVDELFYEKGRVGEMLMNATYMPMNKGEHQVDMHLFRDQSEVSSLSVLYREGKNEDKINGIFDIEELPLEMLNPMIPMHVAQLGGKMWSNIEITGTNKNPILNGTLKTDSATVFAKPISTTFRLDDSELKMTKNKLKFNKYHIYALGENPLVINGMIDATKHNRPTADLQLTATNLQLINAKKTRESLAYGKLFVNVNATLKGMLQSLQMRGNMRMLGTTNMTYVMLDTPLEIEDGFNDLVTFSYFTDTLPRRKRQFGFIGGAREVVMAGGIDAQMTFRIDPNVRLKIDLNEDATNHVELVGGGDLSFRYSRQGDMTMNGRYTITDGSVRYNIPVIPLTEFSVKNGSYIDWSGDVMNPYLNISAYTRTRASVRLDEYQRIVDFNPGIEVKNYLDKMAVNFTLETPNDAGVQEQLLLMGEEERSKQAISLLVAGVYLAGDGVGSEKLDFEAALTTVLQRQINNMLGNLMGEVPVSFEVDTYDGSDENGMRIGRRIDYLMRFYKGFFNERLYTSLGLRYSTNDPILTNQLLIDDLSFEYRFDNENAHALKLFMGKEYKNIFEGEIGRLGLNYTLRRKVKRLGDLFFKPHPNPSSQNRGFQRREK